MSKLQTEQGQSFRTFTGQLRLMAQRGRVYEVAFDLLNDRVTRNKTRYINLEANREQFLHIPILVAYVGSQVGDGHNFTMKTDPKTGKRYPSFTGATDERMVGVTSFDDGDVKVVKRGSDTWIVAQGIIYEWYAKELVDKLASQGGGMDISIETLVTAMRLEGDVEVEEQYEILGVTILGDKATPAVAGASVKTLSEDDFEELRLRVAAMKDTNTITKGVNRNMNKAKLTELSKLFEGYTVLGGQDMTVHLMSANGVPKQYIFSSEADMNAVVPERIADCDAKVTFDGAEYDLSAVTGELINSSGVMAAKLSAETERANSAEKRIADMEALEKTRRLKACKDAVKTEFNSICSLFPDAQLAEGVCDAINARIDAGEFCGDMDKAWDGEAKACAALNAVCMEKVRDSKKAEQDRKRRTLNYNIGDEAKDNNDPVTAFLNEKGLGNK